MTPATVSYKLPKLVGSLIIVLALCGLEIPAASGEIENKAVKQNLIADGTYLYGETPQPEQVMRSYVVFQKHQEKIVGALYYPRSDFECFTGSAEKNRLKVSSLNSKQLKVSNNQIELSSLHQIKSISANDQRILSMCKQENTKIANRN